MEKPAKNILVVDDQGTHAEIRGERIDLSSVAREIRHKLQEVSPERTVEVAIAPDAIADADAQLRRIALENLLGNAWKFTCKKQNARIEFGVQQCGVESVYFVRDNGAGFDMADAEKLLGAFQRLHSSADFPGSGIGLTTVQRIIRRHGGRVRVDSAVGRGTTFYFTLNKGETER